MKEVPENHIKLIGRVPVGPRGQVVIPAEVRQRLGFKPGEYLLALAIPDSDAVAFVHESKLDELIQKAGDPLAKSLHSRSGK